MTPVHIEIMLKCYYQSEAEIGKSPAEQQASHELQNQYLITADLQATDKGTAYVQMLLNTPLPVWADPRSLK